MKKRPSCFAWALLLTISTSALSAAPLLFDRQGHDFAYFTGVEIPGAYLIIDGIRRESLPFFTIGEKEAEAEGIASDLVRDPKGITGIEKALPAEQFGAALAGLGQKTRVFYTMFKPEEIGIRIEDTIAITETGYENLSLGVPRTVADIEALKKSDGLLQSAGDTRSKRGRK
jgi:hypothetical protein